MVSTVTRPGLYGPASRKKRPSSSLPELARHTPGQTSSSSTSKCHFHRSRSAGSHTSPHSAQLGVRATSGCTATSLCRAGRSNVRRASARQSAYPRPADNLYNGCSGLQVRSDRGTRVSLRASKATLRGHARYKMIKTRDKDRCGDPLPLVQSTTFGSPGSCSGSGASSLLRSREARHAQASERSIDPDVPSDRARAAGSVVWGGGRGFPTARRIRRPARLPTGRSQATGISLMFERRQEMRVPAWPSTRKSRRPFWCLRLSTGRACYRSGWGSPQPQGSA